MRALCPVCRSFGELTKEHVWPRWFLKRMDLAGAPPRGWAVNGVPVQDREGQQIHEAQRQRVFLNVCGSCNSEMDRLIEKPAKEPVSLLALNGWRGALSSEEWRAVGIWWAKVLLLTGLQGARFAHPILQRAVDLTFATPMPDVAWLALEAAPPSHVSVFMHNADLSLTGMGHDLVIPAQVHFEDGAKAHCHVLSLATSGMCVTVVSHPGIAIRHPMVEAGEAWELLHGAPGSGDLRDLKPLSAKHVNITRGGGVPAGHVVDDSDHTFLITLFGYES